jgi:hypothetical protein
VATRSATRTTCTPLVCFSGMLVPARLRLCLNRPNHTPVGADGSGTGGRDRECLSRKQPNEAWLEYHKGHFKSAFLLKSQPVEDGSVATTPAKLRLRMDSSWPRVVVSLILACWNSPDTRPDSTRLVMLLQQARHDLEAAQLIDTPVRNSSPAATGLSLQSSIPVASSVGQKVRLLHALHALHALPPALGGRKAELWLYGGLRKSCES